MPSGDRLGVAIPDAALRTTDEVIRLDIKSLIALYFAVRDNAGDTDAAVWSMNPWWLNRETFSEYVLFPANDVRASKHAPLLTGQELKWKVAAGHYADSREPTNRRAAWRFHNSWHRTGRAEPASASKRQKPPLSAADDDPTIACRYSAERVGNLRDQRITGFS